MPRSASELTYYFHVIMIIYASFGIRININVIRIIYASFGIRINLLLSCNQDYLCLVRHLN